MILSCGLGIEAEFPRRGNGRVEKLYYPEMRIVFATDLETGIAVCPEYGPMGGEHATSEVRLSSLINCFALKHKQIPRITEILGMANK